MFRSSIKNALNIIYLSLKKNHLESLIDTTVLQIFISTAFIEERVGLSDTLMTMILQAHLFSFVVHSYCIILSVSILSVYHLLTAY